MKCPKCGSEKVSTERRIDGMNSCRDCGHSWRNAAQGAIVSTCHEDRNCKLCLCCVCGEIHKCVPSFDFYTTKDHGDGLVCERCFYNYIGLRLNDKQAGG